MRKALRYRFVILVLCLSTLLPLKPAEAQQIGPTQGQAIGILVLIVGVGAAIGVGTYYLVRKPPSITGCVASTADGPQMQNEKDQQTYMLVGDVADVKPGDRVRVKGKKKKPTGGKGRMFLVEKLSKDFGTCQVQPATQ